MSTTNTTTNTTTTIRSGSDADRAAGSPVAAAAGAAEPVRRGRPRWPLFGAAGAVAAFVAVIFSMPTLTEEEYSSGIDVVDQLERGGYHIAFILGLVSVACLLVAASGWRRWAELPRPSSSPGGSSDPTALPTRIAPPPRSRAPPPRSTRRRSRPPGTRGVHRGPPTGRRG